MLIDLSCYSPIVINPIEYLTTLAVRIDTDDRPECGVFAGKHQDFWHQEEGKRVALENKDEGGSRLFLIDRSESIAINHQVARWSYVAIGWDSGVYVEHPYIYKLTLEEHGGSENFWSLALDLGGKTGLTLILPDYKPGILHRIEGLKEKFGGIA